MLIFCTLLSAASFSIWRISGLFISGGLNVGRLESKLN